MTADAKLLADMTEARIKWLRHLGKDTGKPYPGDAGLDGFAAGYFAASRYVNDSVWNEALEAAALAIADHEGKDDTFYSRLIRELKRPPCEPGAAK